MKTAIGMIDDERSRQLVKEGYSAEHDDAHYRGELADAAAVYADAAGAMVRGASPEDLHVPDAEEEIYCGMDAVPAWPFESAALKLSSDPIRNLVKAGALIVAEIDRLQRIKK